MTTIPLGRRLPGASGNLPGRPDPDTGPGQFPLARKRPAPSLFGLAPGGVCHAVSVAGNAVRSYRTVSPLPSPSRDRAVSFLWHCPWNSPRLRAVSSAGRYPAPHVHGARTFLPRRLSALARAAVRPTDATDLGALAHQIKQSRMKPLTIAAALRPSIGRRGRRRARGGSDAGTP